MYSLVPGDLNAKKAEAPQDVTVFGGLHLVVTSNHKINLKDEQHAFA